MRLVRQRTLGSEGICPVELSDEFRKRAFECFRWAQGALTVRARAEWLNLAQFWHQLAQTAEAEKGEGGLRPQPPVADRDASGPGG
jgi:hypothetical protein